MGWDWRLEAGGWRLDAGGWRLEAGAGTAPGRVKAWVKGRVNRRVQVEHKLSNFVLMGDTTGKG